jgi:hypothetical protein
MESTKLKIKVGEHEFEAEGPVEIVQAQLEAFKTLISVAQTAPSPAKTQESKEQAQNQYVNGSPINVGIEKIMHVAGRVVSLTALPASTEDAALLIILGNKDLRNNVSVTGQEIGDGLAQSGRPVPRVDRIMEKALSDALILKTGVKRATRYRLTNQGQSKAMAIAKELIASLP